MCSSYQYVPTSVMTDAELLKYRVMISPVAANNETYKKCKGK